MVQIGVYENLKWKTFLKDLYVPIKEKDKQPKNMIDAEWDKLDRKAVAILRLNVANSVYFHIA